MKNHQLIALLQAFDPLMPVHLKVRYINDKGFPMTEEQAIDGVNVKQNENEDIVSININAHFGNL